MFKKATITLVVLLIATHAFAENEPADDLAYAITKFFWNPAVSGHGVALDDGEHYHHSITVQYTGKEGDSVEIQVADSRAFLVSRSPSRKDLIARLRKYRGRLPADFTFDRLDANARG